MAESKKLDYANIVNLSLLLFMIYFVTLINLHAVIIKNHTPGSEIISAASCAFNLINLVAYHFIKLMS
jgi:hypothetical protein